MNNYEEHILSFGNQLGFKNLKEANLFKLKNLKPDGIVVVGMGGSGLAGNVLLGLAKSIGLKTPILLWKSYDLPDIDFKKPLIIFMSFSGNTAETVSGFKKLLAFKKKMAMAAITTGGELKRMAEAHNVPLVSFNAQNLTAREALGYTYYALIKVLRKLFPFLRIQDFSRQIKPLKFKNQAKKLAATINRSIPLIYTDSNYSHLGYIWKINFNETAKHPAFANSMPEMYHNEITGFEKQNFHFLALFLKDAASPKPIVKKTAVTEKILKNSGIKTIGLNLTGKNQEEKTWNSIILSHLTSLYLAKLKKVNPTQTRFTDQIKMTK